MSYKSDNPKKEEVVKVLQQNMGVVTGTCQACNISRQTFYRWCKEDKEFLEQVEDMKDVAIDYAESKLFSQIKDGNTTAIIFYLKTQGRARGYVERSEYAITSDKPASWFDQVPMGYTGKSEKGVE